VKLARRLAAAALGVALAIAPGAARADAVDDAFARGGAAARAGDWEAAIAAWEQAAGLLAQPNALLEYDLGTAYAHTDQLGRATFHQRRAHAKHAQPTAEVAEAARFNLDVVRRRAELAATVAGATIDRPETWWDLVVEAIGSPGIGWLALASGWAFLLVLGLHVWRRRSARAVARSRSSGIWGAVLVVLALAWLVPGVLHALALRADRTAPEAIVLDARVDARDGPGSHRRVELALQGGARVRIVDRTPGWCKLRLPGGVEGWVPEISVGELAPRRPAAAAP
jgi:hypothetical protein